jgi:hypothetical protein
VYKRKSTERCSSVAPMNTPEMQFCVAACRGEKLVYVKLCKMKDAMPRTALLCVRLCKMKDAMLHTAQEQSLHGNLDHPWHDWVHH